MLVFTEGNDFNLLGCLIKAFKGPHKALVVEILEDLVHQIEDKVGL